MILPNLYSRCNKPVQATEAFKKALQYFPEDLELLVDFASHLDLFNSGQSAQIYLRLLSLFKSDRQFEFSPSVQIYNNMGVTFMKNRMFREASEVFAIGLHRVRSSLDSGDVAAPFKYSFSEKSGPEHKAAGEDLVLLKSLRQAILYNQAMCYEMDGRFRRAVRQYQDILERNPLMIEARLRLVRIYHVKGQKEQMDRELSQSLIITQEQQSDLSRLTLSAFTYLQFRRHNFSRVIHLLTKLKMDEHTDTYMFNLFASCVYKLITLRRSETTEIKRMIKVAAEKANLVISRKDEQNSSAAVLLGNLLMERGKLAESKQIFDKVMIHDRTAVFNGAVAEFLLGAYGKALTILQSPRSRPAWKRSTFFAILLVLNKRFRKGEKKMKYRVLRNPSRKNYFNFASILHERVKRVFEKRSQNLGEMQKLTRQLDWAAKVFRGLLKQIESRTTISVENNFDRREIERQKLGRMKRLVSDQIFYIRENRANYQDVIREEQEKEQRQKTSLRQRGDLVEERKRERQEKQRRQQSEHERRQAERGERARKVRSEIEDKEEEFFMMFGRKNNKREKRDQTRTGERAQATRQARARRGRAGAGSEAAPPNPDQAPKNPRKRRLTKIKKKEEESIQGLLDSDVPSSSNSLSSSSEDKSVESRRRP